MVYIPEGVFPSILKQYEEHDKTCGSLPDIWFGRKGGVSCWNEQNECVLCDVTFYNEGLRYFGEDWDNGYCECCYQRAVLAILF